MRSATFLGMVRGSMEGPRRWGVLAAVVGAGMALDQIAKQLAEAHLRGRGLVPVVEGFFELRYARNPGAFFSLGAELSPPIRRGLFVVASAAASALILRLYAKSEPAQRILRVALMLLLAGALGNLVDRVLWGEVIDFAHFHFRDVFDWATFNVADVLLLVGVVLLFFYLRRDGDELEEASEQGEAEASKAATEADADADESGEAPQVAAAD